MDIRKIAYQADSQVGISYYGNPTDAQAKLIRDRIFAELVRKEIMEELLETVLYKTCQAREVKEVPPFPKECIDGCPENTVCDYCQVTII